MKEHDITVTLNVEEHEAMMEMLSLASQMFYFTEGQSSLKANHLNNVRHELALKWSYRFD